MKIAVCVSGNQELLQQDIECDIIREIITPTVLFNKTLDENKYDYYCFLSHRDNFTYGNSLNIAINKLQSDKFFALYSDTAIKDSGPVLYPAFHPNIMDLDLLINSPLVMKHPGDLRFNTSLELFYNYEFLKRFSKRFMPIHNAQVLFTSIMDSTIDFTKETNKLKQCLGQ